jgi:hypothetical protein
MTYRKYGNKKTEINNITFDSKREALRYQELKLLEAAGCIKQLQLQPEFLLKVSTGKSVGKYKADFRYWDVARKSWVVEDSKGVRTAVYRLKKRIVEEIYAIKIEEV